MPTRAAGLARLQDFAPHAGRAYAAHRNEDRGPGARQVVSGLSPWLRHRLLTETEVIAAVLGHHTPAAAAKFIEEVCWRGYFKGHLEARPSIWTDYRRALAGLHDPARRKGPPDSALAAATEGRTGIDCFDAWVTELQETGYLHNHARMCFASIWIFTLRLPWQLGADFTYRHFIDGDPASNTLSWRWVAGLHTPGKYYLARAEAIRTCSGGRFQADGLATQAEPLTESRTHACVPLSPSPTRLPTGRFALLLTEEDLQPESLPIDPRQVIGVAGATHVEGRSPLPPLQQVSAFTEAAMGDAFDRARVHFGCDVEWLPDLDVDSIAEWAERIGASVVVTPWAPVGPVAERLADAVCGLGSRGLKLHLLRRAYDEAIWPHATRGFFALRERIPRILAALNLQTGRPSQGELPL